MKLRVVAREVIVFGRSLPGTARAVLSICPARNHCFPFILPFTQPPDFLTAF